MSIKLSQVFAFTAVLIIFGSGFILSEAQSNSNGLEYSLVGFSISIILLIVAFYFKNKEDERNKNNIMRGLNEK